MSCYTYQILSIIENMPLYWGVSLLYVDNMDVIFLLIKPGQDKTHLPSLF